ncbi:helix-turn-helix domain-containing protein [Candidatus Borrarchaeum sp.]|uniref:helix-turn-helix domain-containing protein n=1 Tax=Candidatus Borrarchaeum sp. TaxID=2846742 RepID=UPI00257E5DCB|nr:helix-turn-helix domain-containing protein [Candidatus Borrarchaeum sp.]
MIQTIKFRLYPNEAQEQKLHEIFAIYNRVKRIGYNLLFHGEDHMKARFGEVKTIQQCLMSLCHNNPYVSTILVDIKPDIGCTKDMAGKTTQIHGQATKHNY